MHSKVWDEITYTIPTFNNIFSLILRSCRRHSIWRDWIKAPWYHNPLLWDIFYGVEYRAQKIITWYHVKWYNMYTMHTLNYRDANEICVLDRVWILGISSPHNDPCRLVPNVVTNISALIICNSSLGKPTFNEREMYRKYHYSVITTMRLCQRSRRNHKWYHI